jgi:GR25 family glycosyltransferase involved in LPS biosynthesis/tetratricopeptide (TPR) repeat protein
MGVKICLNMIVKDEEHIIRETLEKLVKQITFSYWVICDTGSTDKTREIITDFFKEKGIPGELLQHTWQDFGHNRTLALQGAYKKADYIFVFDADDTIHGDFKIPDKLTHDFYKLKFGSGFTYLRPLLITAHKKTSFKGVLHEFLSLDEGRPTETMIEGNYYVDSGKTGSRSRDKDKYLKDALILKEAYAKELEKPGGGLSGRYAFYCAQSYKDCGKTEECIEWYTLVADKLQTWVQEKYYACLMLGMKYREKKDVTKSLEYYFKAEQFDPDRTEGIIFATEILKDANLHSLNVALYEKYKNYNKDPQEKLFLFRNMYDDIFEFNVSISAYFCNNHALSYECSKKVIMNNICTPAIRDRTFKNMRFIPQQIADDPNTLGLFNHLTMYAQTTDEPREIGIMWELLFKKNRELLNRTPKFKPNPAKKGVFFSITSCKRLDLFTETMNSILNFWTDADQIDEWFCVDDNSSKEDRAKMKKLYPWVNFYHKSPDEKGHRESMNIIWNKLKDTKPKYWIHMEDDFFFYVRRSYVQDSIKFLDSQTDSGIKQILFNRGYAETMNDLDLKGYLPLSPGFVVHEFKQGTFPYKNCHYWPHYSFRPSMIDVGTILSLGNYDSPNTFFEQDYAQKWVKAGYRSAFFDMITCRHTGRLTSQRNDKSIPNAYDLNKENQFGTTQSTTSSKAIKVINLKRRPDRKEYMTKLFKENDITEYEFVEGVDGKLLKPNSELKTLFEGNDFGSRVGTIGCALTHYNLWKSLLNDPNHEYYVIFEDDITLTSHFKQKFSAISQIFPKVPYLFLGYHMFRVNREATKHIYVKESPRLNIGPMQNNLNVGAGFGYTLNKVGARILVDYIAENGIKHGIDYVVKICPKLQPAEVMPQLVFSEWDEQSHPNPDTDIQRELQTLDFSQVREDEFVFFENLDHIGDDCGHTLSSVDNMKMMASANPECAAFNTLGFFKSKVDTTSLKLSSYFKPGDGLYVKKTSITKRPRIKLIGNWQSTQKMKDEYGVMPHTGLDLSTADETDYYVIVNKPNTDEYYDAKKTIVFQMEPWVYDANKRWGIKTWGQWANPDPKKFLHVHSHRKFLNPAQWTLNGDLSTFPTKNDKVCAILSDKKHDTGHTLRIQLARRQPIDVFGKQNYHTVASYIGPVPDENRYNVYANYKYALAVENNSELNYATEKIWEPLMCECLPFYWGCPNLEDYLDPDCFVRLPLNDMEKAVDIIQTAISEDWWTQRIEKIRAAKKKIVDELGFFAIISRVINPPKRTKAVILTLQSSHSRVPLVEKVRSDLTAFGMKNEVFYGVNGEDIVVSDTEITYQGETMKYDPNVRLNGQRMAIGEFGCSWSHVKLYQKLVADTDYDHYLVVEDDAQIVGDLNVLRNLPTDFDIIQLGSSEWYPYVKTNKVNTSFFHIEKKFFNHTTAYVVSKAGARKLLEYTAGHINVPADDLLSNSFIKGVIQVMVPNSPVFEFPEGIQSTTNMKVL